MKSNDKYILAAIGFTAVSVLLYCILIWPLEGFNFGEEDFLDYFILALFGVYIGIVNSAPPVIAAFVFLLIWLLQLKFGKSENLKLQHSAKVIKTSLIVLILMYHVIAILLYTNTINALLKLL